MDPRKYSDTAEQHKVLVGGICRRCHDAALKLCPKCGMCEKCYHFPHCTGEFVRTE